jgi:hypothetical protein
LVFKYLPRSYKEGAKDPIAREKCTMQEQSQAWHLQTLSWALPFNGPQIGRSI